MAGGANKVWTAGFNTSGVMVGHKIGSNTNTNTKGWFGGFTTSGVMVAHKIGWFKYKYKRLVWWI